VERMGLFHNLNRYLTDMKFCKMCPFVLLVKVGSKQGRAVDKGEMMGSRGR
jgi:hypothetical protein